VASPGQQFAGLELLATAVVALDSEFVVRYANPAAENLLATGAKSLNGQPFLQFFVERAELERALGEALTTHWDYSAQNVTYGRVGREPLPLACTMTRIESEGLALLAELRPIEEQLRYAREERLVFEQQANRELIAISRTKSRIRWAACAARRSCSSASSISPSCANTRKSSSRKPIACSG